MQPYRPSSGTEGHAFIDTWCGDCAKSGDGSGCEITERTMVYDIDDPLYPREWVVDADGPECTAFVQYVPEPWVAPDGWHESSITLTDGSECPVHVLNGTDWAVRRVSRSTFTVTHKPSGKALASTTMGRAYAAVRLLGQFMPHPTIPLVGEQGNMASAVHYVLRNVGDGGCPPLAHGCPEGFDARIVELADVA